MDSIISELSKKSKLIDITKQRPSDCNKQKASTRAIYHLLLSSLVLLLPLHHTPVSCEHNIDLDNGPATSLYDFYLETFSDHADLTDQNNDNSERSLPTPTIDSLVEITQREDRSSSPIDRYDSHGVGIKPARVYHNHAESQFEFETDLFSPVFNLKSMDPILHGFMERYSDSSNSYQNDAQPTDALGYSDLIETGSGNFENSGSPEDTTNLLDESNNHNEYDQGASSVAPTAVQSQTFPSLTPSPNIINEDNQAPYLKRRLPRLAVTAGQVWKYFIPSDTFIDEDGDLRKLRSTIVRKNNINPFNKLSLSNLTSSPTDFAQYYSWVQYDATVQLLYGLPTEDDVGRHELTLTVSDRFGATSQETIEIHVRPHQSSRAFTHQFQINNISWEPEKFPSMVDALGELVKQISTRVFMDRAFENFFVQHYSIDDQTNSSSSSSQDNRHMSFSLTWSNNSIPIHPCNIGRIENLFRSLINAQFLRSDWTLDTTISQKLPPSVSLLRVLEPDFKPESVGISLLGSCNSEELFKNNAQVEHDNSDSMPKVRVKIGRLAWKLGQPIEYRIPVETFGSDRGSYTTRDLQLSLHTIDGLTLDKDPNYNFIDFDQEAQLITGLPFDQEDHVGPHEVQITARHPKSGYKVREVFIIDIESQDLTTMNNRAFQVSLYFHSRMRSFGPQERVSLSHKIVAATTGGEGDASMTAGDKRIQQITVMNIAKIVSRAQLMSRVQVKPEAEFIDITKYERKADLLDAIDLKEAGGPLYKYTWTNESIGYLGDCPVEVIKENILYSLEQSMLDFRAPNTGKIMEDQNNSDSARFFERLRQYFEPELDLVHLRFEPLGACVNAMELHDVGNGDLADMIDRASELDTEPNEQIQFQTVPPAAKPRIENEAGNEEYWSIVVLLVLVVTLIFVIIMFFMGMHTYKINQDKRFEMQVKLAQARQNSMYLSSMILANLASPNDCGSASAPNGNRNMCIVQDEEKASRKPVILDNEKCLFIGDQANGNGLRSLAVQLNGSSVRTTPVKPNSTVTLDSMASISWQPSVMGLSMSPSALLYTPIDGKQRSMTLNRGSSAQRQIQFPPDVLNHSQSILTVASLAGPLPVGPQGNIPMVYAPVLPVMNGPNPAYNYASLQRVHHHGIQGQLAPVRVISQDQLINNGQQTGTTSQNLLSTQQQNLYNGMDPQTQEIVNPKMKSSSRSSSASATTNSVISNPNYSPHR